MVDLIILWHLFQAKNLQFFPGTIHGIVSIRAQRSLGRRRSPTGKLSRSLYTCKYIVADKTVKLLLCLFDAYSVKSF